MFLSTGISIIDQELSGGLKKGSSVIISATPGVQDIQFALQCFYSHLESDGPGLYVVNNKKPSHVKAIMKDFDWDVSGFENRGRCAFIDAYSGLMSSDLEKENVVKDPVRVDNVWTLLSGKIKEMKPGIVVFDSLSTLIDLAGDENKAVEFVRRLSLELKKNKTTLCALFTDWPYEKDTISEIEQCFDCVIRLKAIEQKVIMRSYFSIDRAEWIPDLKKKDIPYKIVSPGGVRVFIPKIVITGPFNAGKTSFIHSASTKAVSVDRLGTTVALDHGHVEFGGFSVDLFGTPGQERFDPIMEHLGGEALGVIIVVDSTDPKGFARAKDLLKRTKTDGLPTVVVANKSDLKGALKPAGIRKQMMLQEDVPIIPVIAEDVSSVQKDKPCALRKSDVEKVLSKIFDMVV